MNINFFKILGLIGTLSAELSKIAEDGKVEPAELLTLGIAICGNLNLPISFGGNIIDPSVIMEVITKLSGMLQDGKISIEEIIQLVTDVCNKLGIDLTDKGIKVN